MMRWLWSNLSSIGLALILAILVWVVAVNEENPTEQRAILQAIPIEFVGKPPEMLLGEPIATAATVTLRAPRLTWSTLTPDRIHVRADLTGLPAGVHDLPLAVTVEERLARIVGVSPARVLVTLEESGARPVPVHLNIAGEVAVGYRAGEAELSATEALVSGPISLVDLVSEVRAAVNIAGARGGVEAEVPLVPVDGQGEPLSGVRLEPATLQVSVPVQQLGGFRDVAVKVVVTGQVQAGYRLTNIIVAPPIVTVFAADPNDVAGLPGFVETAALSIENASDDIAVRIPLRLGQAISLVGEQSVLVQVSIAAIESSLTVPRDLELSGLGPGLAAVASPPSVDVILSGPLLTLEALQPDDVRVILNLVGLGRGTHQVRPTIVVLPDKVVAETVLPATIEVTITAGAPPTLSPTATP